MICADPHRLNNGWSNPVQILNTLARWWNNFWFTPEPVSSICLYRVLCGLLCILVGLTRLPNLLLWYGPHALISLNTLSHVFQISNFNLLLWWHQSELTTWFIYILYMLAAVCLMVGLWTRISAILVWFCLIAFDSRNPILTSHGDLLLAISALLLSFSPANRKFSIDCVLQSSTPKDVEIQASPWVQKLLQIETASVYLQTFISKIQVKEWLEGHAIYYVTHIVTLRRFPIPYLFDHNWTCCLITWGVLAVELALCTLIWIRKFRYGVLLIGTVFHLGINWCLFFPTFQYVMLALYINFVDAVDIDRIVGYLKDTTTIGRKVRI
jgi:uncharacterized membrane protein YphA (DoxX/SURF4 family)